MLVYPLAKYNGLSAKLYKIYGRVYWEILPKSALKCPYMLAGHASGCWLSALGAGVPYNRERKKESSCATLIETQDPNLFVVTLLV